MCPARCQRRLCVHVGALLVAPEHAARDQGLFMGWARTGCKRAGASQGPQYTAPVGVPCCRCLKRLSVPSGPRVLILADFEVQSQNFLPLVLWMFPHLVGFQLGGSRSHVLSVTGRTRDTYVTASVRDGPSPSASAFSP